MDRWIDRGLTWWTSRDASTRRVIAAYLATTLLPVFLTQPAQAQSRGTFSPTGSMISGRSNHTATLLPDGRVLISGGSAGKAIIPDAELYNPGSGSFELTGPLNYPRLYHTATLLADGRVLIAGGSDKNGSVATAEIYDPSTGRFTPTGDMAVAQFRHTATLLPDGKVLIAGGIARYGPLLADAEIYDPDTGTFTPIAWDQSLVWPSATSLPDGRVLLAVGGIDRRGLDLTYGFGQVYNSSTRAFAPVGSPSGSGSYWHTATLLPGGNVLLAGGGDGDNGLYFSTTALFDPKSNTFTRINSMTTVRVLHTATLFPDGTVLLAGGESGAPFPGYIVNANTEVYDPAAAAFIPGPIMATSRSSHTATLLTDGTVLIAGGDNASSPGLAVAEIYRPPKPAPPPQLLSLSGDGKGPGAILHAATQQIVSAGNPATAGEALEIYCTGLVDGSAIPPQLSIGGRLAEVLWFGGAPGFAGLYQINVRVPGGAMKSPSAAVRLDYMSRPSNEVTVAIQ